MVAGTSNHYVDAFFWHLACLDLKDLGLAEKFLGICSPFNESLGYQLDQEVIVRELLQKNGLEKANAVRCPMRGEDLGEDDPG